MIVAGAGAVSPLGNDRRAFAAALQERAKKAPGSNSPPATTVRGFDASTLPEAKALRRATPHAMHGVAAAIEALREAGGEASAPPPEESALVFASALGSTNFSYRLWRELLKSGPLGASPVLFSEGVPNAVAGHVARALRLLGPGHMLGGGWDSGLRAVGLARDLLELGRARRVVVGAAEEVSEIATRAYRRLGLAAREEPEPGSRTRRGVTRGRALVLSEGAAVLVLEKSERRGGTGKGIASIRAIESAQLSRRSREEDAEAIARLVRRAVAAADAALRDVSWLGSAANGTFVDAIESAALVRLRRDGFEPELSRAVRAAAGDALTVTPLLQSIEALPVAAGGALAGVLSISPFGAASVLLLGPAELGSSR